MPKFLLPLLLLLCSSVLVAQGLAGKRNADPAIMLHVGYGPFATAGDLADRFGGGWALDGGITFAPRNGKIEFGGRVQYGFGDRVREDPLSGLRTSDGFLIGNQREPADIQLRHRQLFVGAAIGYTFSFGKNERAGIHLKTTPGYFYHRIRFQEDAVQAVPQVGEAFEAGYDRLTGGFAVHQFLGYQQLALDRRLNFYAGVEALVGFTKGLRNFNFTTGTTTSPDGRNDVYLGAKVGLIIPFYLGEGREIFYK